MKNPEYFDDTGKFKPGNPGGRGGNPRISRQLSLRQAMLRAVDDDTISGAIAELVRLIHNDRSGRTRVAAIELLLAYTLGKPEQAIALDVRSDRPPAEPIPLNLDANDVAALARIRQNMLTPVVVEQVPKQ